MKFPSKTLAAAVAASVLALSAPGCGSKGDKPAVAAAGSGAPIATPKLALGEFSKDEFADKTLAILSGSSFDQVAREMVNAKLYIYRDSPAASVEAMLAGEAIATLVEEPVGRKFAAKNPEALVVLSPPIDIENYAPIFPKKDNGALRGEFNAFLEKIRAEGVYEDMVKRWVDTPDSPPMPEIALKNTKKRVLKFATSDCDPPFSMKDESGKLVGFDVEMATRFAQAGGYGLEIQVMQFPDIIPAVTAGKLDFAANVITINDERKTLVDFSEPVYYGGTVVLARKN
jgi:polar amino acid transport system substrate-binding protein